MNKETKIQREIQDLLNKKRIINWRMSDSKVSGMPDLIAVYRGYVLGLEVKTDTGKPTELQNRVIRSIRDAEGFAYIVTSTRDVLNALHLVDLELRDKQKYEFEEYYETKKLSDPDFR